MIIALHLCIRGN